MNRRVKTAQGYAIKFIQEMRPTRPDHEAKTEEWHQGSYIGCCISWWLLMSWLGAAMPEFDMLIVICRPLKEPPMLFGR